MRKTLVALFVLGLVVAFAAPASALDVKFSGSYYAAGVFESNHSLAPDSYRETGSNAARYRASSASYVAQRLRLQPEFKIAEGLSLVTRFDALEKKWGDNRTFTGSNNYDNTNRTWDYDEVTRGNVRTQENLEWERAYVDFNTAIGRFMVGYFDCICYGTDFLDTHVSRAGVKWEYPMGNFTFMAQWEHAYEGGSGGNGGVNPNFAYATADRDVYSIGADYRWKGGSAGIQLQNYYHADTDYALSVPGYVTTVYTINPYAKATVGPFYFEGEFWYGFGTAQDYRVSSQPDVDLSAFGLYLNGRFDAGPFYVGAMLEWITGDDPGSTDKREGNVMALLTLGQAFDPCLIMFNDLLNTWGSNYYGNVARSADAIGTFEDNVWLWQIYGGWKATPALDFKVAFSYAYADEKPNSTGTPSGTPYVDDEYGYEVDLYMNYKIYNNLTYMVGFGYWWAGDYFKGTDSSFDVKNDYVVMHRLMLAF